MTERLIASLLDYAFGSMPATIALSRLLMDCTSEADARQALDAASASSAPHSTATARLRDLRELWNEHPEALATVSTTLDRLRQPGSGQFGVREWAEAFDRVVETSPEASVAIYSLGSPDLLAAATDEVRDWMQASGLLGPDRDGLDLGCGIGRFVGALAPHLRSVVGIDVSAGMVAEARRRCADLANVRILQGSGHALEAVAPGSVDIVLASDVFPYLVDAGSDIVERHVEECARVLRPGGHLLILNYAYGGSDIEHTASLSEAAGKGLRLVRGTQRPFHRWDAAVYLLERSGQGPQARLRA